MLVDVVYGVYAGVYGGGCRLRVWQHSLQAARLRKPRIPKKEIQKILLQVFFSLTYNPLLIQIIY